MRITQWGEFGVHCAAFLAERATHELATASATEIASAQGIDLQYAQQILQRLRRGGIVESVRGHQGGYKLSRDPKDITLRQLLHAAEGQTFEVMCDHKPFKERCEPGAQCKLRLVWRDLKEHIDSFLDARNLAGLLSEGIVQPTGLVTLSSRISKDILPD